MDPKDAITSSHRGRNTFLVIIALLAVLIVLSEILGWPFLRAPFRSQLSQLLQRPVIVGENFTLRLFGSIRLDTDNFVIGTQSSNTKQSETQQPHHGKNSDVNLIKAHNGHIEIPYHTVLGLLSSKTDKPIVISVLNVERLDANLTRDDQGNANWSVGSTTPHTTNNTPLAIPQFEELSLKAGHIVLDDKLSTLSLNALVSTLEGSKAIIDTTKNVISGRGLQVHATGRYQGHAYQLKIKAAGVLPLIASGKTQVAVPLNVHYKTKEAEINFEGKAVDVLTFTGLNGAVFVAGPSLAAVGKGFGVTLPTTSAFTLVGQLSKSDKRWSLNKAKLDVGESHLRGDFTFNQSGDIPSLTGNLRGNPLVLADLAPAFGVPADKIPAPTTVGGHVLPQREFDIPSLRAMNADVKLRLQKVRLGNLFERPLQPLEGDLRLKEGVLGITRLLARTADGEVSGSISLDGNVTPAAWNMDLTWAHIRLEKWLAARNDLTENPEKPAENEPPRFVSGQLFGNAKLEGKGNSTASMLGTLNGNTRTWIKEGKISNLIVELMGLDVAQGLGIFISGDELLDMNCAVISLESKQGVFEPDLAIVDTPDSTLIVTGTLSLAKEQMNMQLVARPKDASPLTLRAPLKIKGSLSDPVVRPELNPLGKKVFGSIALGLINPLAALVPLIDLGENGSEEGCRGTFRRLSQAIAAAAP